MLLSQRLDILQGPMFFYITAVNVNKFLKNSITIS